jgi:hypothetical protein
MQQAVTSSSTQITSSLANIIIPTSSILPSALSRSTAPLALKLKSLLDSLNESVQQLDVLDLNEMKQACVSLTQRITCQIQSSSTTQENSVNKLIANEKSLNALLSELVSLVESNKEKIVAIDPALKPLFNLNLSQPINSTSTSTTNSSFYENRYGFTEKDLLECCEFRNTPLHTLTNRRKSPQFPLLDLPTNRTFNYQQQRGFKTQRTIKEEQGTDKASDALDIKYFKSLFASPSTQRVNALLENNASVSARRGARLGSVFGDAPKSSDNTANSAELNFDRGDDVDKKIKIAFSEGVLFGSNKAEVKRSLLKFLIFVVFLVFFMRSFVTISTGNGMSGNKSGSNSGGINLRALTGNVDFEIAPENVSVKFSDVKGVKDGKKELTDIVDFLKDPEQYTAIGARLPKGVLLVGPPGCGKTLLAKAVAGEAGVPYFQANGSDFDEMFVGTGSKRVRSLFEAARAKAPCVIFIDEIDSVGSKRSNSSLHPHANQTINQLLGNTFF